MDVPSSPESEEFLEHQEDDQSITEPENEVVYVDDEGNQVEPEEGTVYIDEYGNMVVGKQEISDQEEVEPENNDQHEEVEEEEEQEEVEQEESAEESEEVHEAAEEDHTASEQPEENEENAEADENPHHPEETEETDEQVEPEEDEIVEEGEQEAAEEEEAQELEEMLEENQFTITEEELRAILEANASKRLELRKLSQEHMRYWKEEQKLLEDIRVAEEREYYESFRKEQLEKTARYFELTKPKDVEPVQKKPSIFNAPPMLDRMESQRIENQRLIQKRKVWHQGLRKSVQEIKRFSKTVSDRNEPDLNESLKNVKLHDEFNSTTLPTSPSSPTSSKKYANIQSPTKSFIENFTEKSREGISPRIETEEKRAQHINQMIVYSSPSSSRSNKPHSLTKMWNETVKNKTPVHLRSTKSIPSVNATSSAPPSAPVSREVSPKKLTPKSKRPNISPMKAKMLELVGMINSPSGAYAPTPPNSTRRIAPSGSTDSTSNHVDTAQLAQQLKDMKSSPSTEVAPIVEASTAPVSEPVVEQKLVEVEPQAPEETKPAIVNEPQEPLENGTEEAPAQEISQEQPREEPASPAPSEAKPTEEPKSIEDNLTAKLHRMVEMRRKMQQKQ